MATAGRALLAALACLALVGLPGSATAGGSPGAPHRVQARGVEFDLTLSRLRVRPGRVIVQFVNAGEDPHDLLLQRLGPGGEPGGEQQGFGVLGPGSYDNLDLALARGATYELWCSLSDHRERGMDAILRTRRHRH